MGVADNTKEPFMSRLCKIFPLILAAALIALVHCGGDTFDFDPSGTETGNPPSCLLVVEDCEDLDEDGVCDDQTEEDDSDGIEYDHEPADDTGNDGGTDTGNPENDDGGTEEDTGTGCLKVNRDY